MIFEGTRNTTCKYIGSRRLTVVMLEVCLADKGSAGQVFAEAIEVSVWRRSYGL